MVALQQPTVGGSVMVIAAVLPPAKFFMGEKFHCSECVPPPVPPVAASVPLSKLPKVLLSLLQGRQSSLSGTNSKYTSSAFILLTSLGGVVVIVMGWLMVMVLFPLITILLVGTILILVVLSLQASHLQGATFIQVSFDAFQKVLTRSVISAPIQILVNGKEELIVPVMVSGAPEAIFVFNSGVNPVMVAPAGILDVTTRLVSFAVPGFGLVIV